MSAKTVHGRTEGWSSPCQGGNCSLRKGRNIFPEHKASPLRLLLTQRCAPFSQLPPCSLFVFTKGLNHKFSQSTSHTLSPRKQLSSAPAIAHNKERLSQLPEILFTTPGLPGLTVLGQGDEYENKHKDSHSFGSAGKSQGWE